MEPQEGMPHLHAMGLNLKRKLRSVCRQELMEPLLQPIHPNITWSMDFMHDVLSTGINFRSLNIIDDYNRECLGRTIEQQHTEQQTCNRTTRSKLVGWRGAPPKIRYCPDIL